MEANPLALVFKPASALGSAYQGVIAEGTGLTPPQGSGMSLQDLAFDFGDTVNGTACDAAGNCAAALACDFFADSGAPPWGESGCGGVAGGSGWGARWA